MLLTLLQEQDLVGWYVFSRKKTQAVLKVSSLNGFRAKYSFLAQLQPSLFVLRIFSLASIVIALARPQTMDVSTRTKTNKGIPVYRFDPNCRSENLENQ